MYINKNLLITLKVHQGQNLYTCPVHNPTHQYGYIVICTYLSITYNAGSSTGNPGQIQKVTKPVICNDAILD